MFGESGRWKDFDHQSRVYYEWKRNVESLISKNPDKKIVIVEVGCGMRVSYEKFILLYY